jgi:hypothetical protein
MLERFTCASRGAPDFEQLVQRYFRVQAIARMGSPAARQADHRLLLLMDDTTVLAAGCHQRSNEPHRRNFVFAAVATQWQGQRLPDGRRTSDALWEVVANDMLERDGADELVVVAKVHQDNLRSLNYCARIGLTSRSTDGIGLVICTGILRPGPASG